MKRVMLTGASGFIGRQAMEPLIAAGFEVHAVSHHSPALSPQATWHTADLLDADQRRAVFAAIRPTHVLHFGWIATPGIYWTSPLNASWKEATLDLLALSTSGGARFVGSGSCAEYDWSPGLCDERATPLRPATPYGIAKAECGSAVVEAGQAWGRIFFLYGPFEHSKRLVSSVIRSLLHGDTAQCTHGNQIRDFLHVKDVAAAFVALLDSDVTGAVNIASGVPVTLREVVETIGRQLHAEDRLEFGAVTPPPNDPPRLTATVERLQSEVGWSPSLTLEDGIADTIRWWRMQP